MFSLKSLSSTWKRALVLQKSSKILLRVFFEEEWECCFIPALFFLYFSSFISAFPHFSVCTYPSELSEGLGGLLKPVSWNRGHGKDLNPSGPRRFLISFKAISSFWSNKYDWLCGTREQEMWCPFIKFGSRLGWRPVWGPSVKAPSHFHPPWKMLSTKDIHFNRVVGASSQIMFLSTYPIPLALFSDFQFYSGWLCAPQILFPSLS